MCANVSFLYFNKLSQLNCVSIKFGETPVSKIGDAICLLKLVSFHISIHFKTNNWFPLLESLLLSVDGDKSIFVRNALFDGCTYKMDTNYINWVSIHQPNKYNGNENTNKVYMMCNMIRAKQRPHSCAAVFVNFTEVVW